ncbi:MAG: hypothetical protein ACRDIC_19775 [bacterium]
MYRQWAAYYDAIYAAIGKDYAREAQSTSWSPHRRASGVSERHDMALFTHDDYTEAFRAAGMEAIHDPQGLIGRGLYIATA